MSVNSTEDNEYPGPASSGVDVLSDAPTATTLGGDLLVEASAAASTAFNPMASLTHARIDPRLYSVYETMWVPMRDGVKLACRVFAPRDAAGLGASGNKKYPVILEYIPYRRRDMARARDDLNYPYLCVHGFVVVHADLRGAGDSEGVMLDEYMPQEQVDNIDLIDYFSKAPYSNGKVGQFGISWGGFNGLQVAFHRPPALKAVVSICSTDNRYTDDVHYMGGALLGENMAWGCHMYSRHATPPDPAVFNTPDNPDRWRQEWAQRLRQATLLPAEWTINQRYNRYWKQGSVEQDIKRLEGLPIMAVSGWADGYSNAPARLLHALPNDVHCIIGGWVHLYPHMAGSHPPMGFLQEMVRFFNSHLKDRTELQAKSVLGTVGGNAGGDGAAAAQAPTQAFLRSGLHRAQTLVGGYDGSQPRYRVWMQYFVEPTTAVEERPGRWVAEPCWPPPPGHIKQTRFRLTGYQSLTSPGTTNMGPDVSVAVATPQTHGMHQGKWFAYDVTGPDLPGRQRFDDGLATCFDSVPLEEPLEILGAPVVQLQVSSDQPVSFACCRLCDVAPDGSSLRVSFGILNLTRRDSLETPTPLEPGREYIIRIQLNDAGHRFEAGHRVRLALSTTMWPMVWPAPKPATLTLKTGADSASHLELPERPPRPADDSLLREYDPPVAAEPMAKTQMQPKLNRREVAHDLLSDVTGYTVLEDIGRYRIEETGTELEMCGQQDYYISSWEPTSARVEIDWRIRLSRAGWEALTTTRTVMTSDENYFYYTAELKGHSGNEVVESRSWNMKIPRDLM